MNLRVHIYCMSVAGQCHKWHMFSYHTPPGRMVAISPQCLLGKVVFHNVSSVFVGHFPNMLERDCRTGKQHVALITHGQELISHRCN